jgi:hypothetical protein
LRGGTCRHKGLPDWGVGPGVVRSAEERHAATEPGDEALVRKACNAGEGAIEAGGGDNLLPGGSLPLGGSVGVGRIGYRRIDSGYYW